MPYSPRFKFQAPLAYESLAHPFSAAGCNEIMFPHEKKYLYLQNQIEINFCLKVDTEKLMLN